MTECPRCGKPDPAKYHTCTPTAVIIREAYLKGMADGAESVSRWIKCKDRMPDIINETILLSDGFDVFPGFYDSMETFRFNGFDECSEQGFDVLYWQPLPSPPEDIYNFTKGSNKK